MIYFIHLLPSEVKFTIHIKKRGVARLAIVFTLKIHLYTASFTSVVSCQTVATGILLLV